MNFPVKQLVAAAALCAPAVLAAEFDRSGGPYVPTPSTVVDAMLQHAGVGPQDFVIDLGSGDGRIVLTAVTRFNAAGGVGVEIDPELVGRANALANKLGVAERARFLRQDVREADLSRASVLTLYLLPGMMTVLRAKLLAELQPGARIVSHDFTFEQWQPDRTFTVETDEKYGMTGTWTSNIFLWIVPARVAGAWRGKGVDGRSGEFNLDIRQAFQHFEGRLERNGLSVEFRDGKISGTQIAFTIQRGDGRREFHSATVGRGEMSGEISDGDRVISRWSAARVP